MVPDIVGIYPIEGGTPCVVRASRRTKGRHMGVCVGVGCRVRLPSLSQNVRPLPRMYPNKRDFPLSLLAVVAWGSILKGGNRCNGRAAHLVMSH